MKSTTHQTHLGAATTRARFVCAFVTFALLGASGLAAADTAQVATTEAGPSAVVRAMSRDLAAAANDGGALTPVAADARLDAMVEAASRHTDFEHMARLVLARHWHTASPDQKRRFVEAFRTMLVYTFAEQIAQVVDEEMVLSAPQTDASGKFATVRGRMKHESGPDFNVQYQLSRRGGEWKLVDLSLEGMSLVTTYRSAIGVQAGRVGMDSLIRQMVARNRGLQAG